MYFAITQIDIFRKNVPFNAQTKTVLWFIPDVFCCNYYRDMIVNSFVIINFFRYFSILSLQIDCHNVTLNKYKIS